MYVTRDIDAVLEDWKSEARHKPMLLRGVRQCGKTSAVRNLAQKFENYVEINLEKKTALHKLFSGDIDIKRIVARLEVEVNTRILPGKTLLFIDEIQECPRAITALRYFYEDLAELHVIAAGSLLEFVLGGNNKEKIDFPVGRVRSIYMYPFSFHEFLAGTGNNVLRSYLDNLQTFSEPNDMHGRLVETYKTFLVVGGMPEAVSEYAATGSILACRQVHRDIVSNFLDDFNKYGASVPADVIRKVFQFALHNVCGQVKASSAISGVSKYYFEESIDLLERAGLVYCVKASPCDTIPIGASEKDANKKLLFFDSGVFLTECGLNTAEILSAEIFQEMNKGNVVEMQTGLELIKNADPYAKPALHYWYRSGANAEVDYVLQQGLSVIPLEVKASGKGSMQSMHSFLETHPASPYGIRISEENFCEYEKIKVFPMYAVKKLLGYGRR